MRSTKRSQPGRSAIVLVPEIALTPQVLWRFQARFGDVVAVLHSALALGERHDEWLRLRSGEARVCVGPRSAVFAPLSDLGLIIVDEEHESSYKHEGDPRYDARSVARRRAAQTGAVLVFGSATPRPESVLAMTRLSLAERVDRRPLPVVEVLDMRGRHQPLHPETRMALADLRRAGGKAIVLLNRRGWSNFLSCRACGHVWLCPNCEVALVLHRGGSSVACHHCGHREPVPSRCPACALGLGRPPWRGHRAARARAARCARQRRLSDLPARRRLGHAGPARGDPAALRAAPTRASWSEPRWSPRATISRTSRWASCSMPTRRCASPISAPRSGRSRSSPSSPGRTGRGRTRAACSCRRSPPTPARSGSRPSTTPTASSPTSSTAAARCATRRSRP